MKNNSLFILIFFFSLGSFAQGEVSIWYFGIRAGLDFNSGSPIALTNSKMSTIEGCASISDDSGSLLFYTNGVNVWNKNHEKMLNGTRLNGDQSSTNSAIIIPKPNTLNKYYVFTVDNLGGENGLQYSEIDMLLDNGLGSITENKNISLHSPSTEKITAVKHQNNIDWWVLSHKWDSNEYVAYKITSSGVDSKVTSPIGIYITGTNSNSIGTIKFSPDGKKVAIANSYNNNNVQLLEFNDLTGILSNPITISITSNSPRGVYGVEFSPNSKLLYTTDSDGSIYQYDIQLPTDSEVNNSRVEIASSITGLGALQIAIDSKIYVAKENSGYLGIIENPNTIGPTSLYINNGVYLGGPISKFGLPLFIQSFFGKVISSENTCFGESTQFGLINPEVSQIWNFDDPVSGINNTSTDINPTHIFTNPGTYNVQVKTTNILNENVTTSSVITISETPVAIKPLNYILCDNNLDDNSENGIIQSFLLSTIDSEILGTQDSNINDVLYFEDSLHKIPIDKSIDYENITAYTQTVYVKVVNKNNYNCFDTTEFDLIVNKIPIYDLDKQKIICFNFLPNIVQIQNPQGNYNYVWTLDNGTIYSTSNSIDFNSTEDIPITGLNLTVSAINPSTPLNTCTNSKSILIRKIESITFTQDDIIINDLSSNNTITINPQDPNFNPDDYEYALGDEDGTTSDFQNELIFEHVVPGIKTLFIRDLYNCDSFEIELSIIGFPHFFTPNNDGFNDTWHVLGVNRNFYTTSIIRVFDRFGKVVANIKPSSDGWNGLYNNTELPETDYWFTAQLIDNDGNIREQKGHFSLIRR